MILIATRFGVVRSPPSFDAGHPHIFQFGYLSTRRLDIQTVENQGSIKGRAGQTKSVIRGGKIEVKDAILKATQVRGRKNVYCIGSFGTRVNFYAQQNRALNLVWALKKARRIKAGSPVAVIGGGVTGLTVAAGLMSYGCRVDIFEAGNVPILRQLETDHRLVHPTINGWPSTKPEITTALPFLEWHVGPCDVVARSLTAQFDSIRSKEKPVLARRMVKRINDLATGLLMVKTDPPHEEPYNLAVIAIGFGDESKYPPFKSESYWYPDGLEHDRNRDKFDKYVVSGCGDGGLIDALRIVHYHFEKGMLAFQTAAELFGTPLAKDIERAEAKARGSRSPAATLKGAYDKAANMLFAAQPPYRQTQERLAASLALFQHTVVLTDSLWDPPFSPNAAPIHKLLVAHARRAGRITYSSGSVVEEDQRYLLNGESFRPKEKTKVIIRHGADPRILLEDLLKEDQIAQLEERQRKLEKIAEPAWDAPFPAMPGFPSHDPTSDEFIENRKPEAEALLRWIDKKAKLVRVIGGYEATFSGPVPAILLGRLFGVETTISTLPKSHGIS